MLNGGGSAKSKVTDAVARMLNAELSETSTTTTVAVGEVTLAAVITPSASAPPPMTEY